ncbi:MAG TPA: Asd/ArgC dimerization domain-containing protein, partial [Candidatus Thermoplasmatota archaeon]|nr:Asd/ArgC dimerization domain-containing protein [Candidatus Thermoplasmatota archaeon]
ESVRAYKVLGHDHQHEIHLAARQAEGAAARRAVRFTPHLVPQNRGLLSTVYVPVRPDADPVAVKAAYEKAYAGAAFVRLVHEPDTTHVRHSNFADVAVDVDTHCGLAIARGAIDNLVKGGSGQAVQNVNLAMGWAETAGLPAAGGGP